MNAKEGSRHAGEQTAAEAAAAAAAAATRLVKIQVNI